MEHAEDLNDQERAGSYVENLEDSDNEQRAGPFIEYPEDSDDEERVFPSWEHHEDSDPEDSDKEARAGPLLEHLEDSNRDPEDSDNEERAVLTTENLCNEDETGRIDPPDRYQILDLMMPMFSGTKDDFGKETVPPLPLFFDRVSEGREPISGSRLFRLPQEILNVVVQSVPEVSLASFALANSDCRQLARSRQFASLHFDYSDQTLAIINQLQQEAVERSNNDGLTGKPALGPCIRRLTVATHPGWVNFRHDVELSEDFNSLPKREQSKRLNNACSAFFGSYLTSIQDLLSNRAVLPHLELLD